MIPPRGTPHKNPITPDSGFFRIGQKVIIMIIGKVVGKVISTRKNEALVGCKFLVVEILSSMTNDNTKMVAVDNVGAGIGDIVLVAQGSAARLACNNGNTPVDAAVVGIVDDGTGLE